MNTTTKFKRMKILSDGGSLDAMVPVTQFMSSDLTVSKGKASASDLMAVLLDPESSLNRDNIYFRNAIRNERYFHNISIDVKGQKDREFDSESANRNYMRNMVQTYASRANKDRPIPVAYPKNPEGRDRLAAQMSNVLIKDLWSKESMHIAQWEIAIPAQNHGKAAFRHVWNPDAGEPMLLQKVDPVTMMPVRDQNGDLVFEEVGREGEFEVSVLSIFEYDYGGGDSVEDAEWCVFMSWEEERTAKKRAFDFCGELIEPAKEKYDTGDGYEDEKVCIRELYVKPGSSISADGLCIVSVGSDVVYATTYPYAHGQLPISEWKINPVRGTRFATSHVHDAVHLQKLINALERTKVETIDKTGTPKLLCIPSIADEVSNFGVHAIAVPSENAVASGARYLNPPEPSNLVFGEQQNAIQAMHDVFGQNEVLIGKDSVKSGTSAKQIAYLESLDSMKISGALRNLEMCTLRLTRQYLLCMQQFVQKERLVRMAGENGELMTLTFTGADLYGADVHLEMNDGSSSYGASQVEQAGMELQMGAATPAEAIERAETGLGETVGNAADRQRMFNQVQQIFQGANPSIDPSIPPMTAIDVLTNSIGINPQFDPVLWQLIQQYRQMLQQQQSQQQAAPGGGNAMNQFAQRQQPGPGQGPDPLRRNEVPG